VAAFAAAQSEIPVRETRVITRRGVRRVQENRPGHGKKCGHVQIEREEEREREREREMCMGCRGSNGSERFSSRKRKPGNLPRSLSRKDAYSPRWSLCIFTRLPTLRLAHLLRPGRPTARPPGISSRPRREKDSPEKGPISAPRLCEHGQVRFVRKRDNAYSIFQRRNCGNALTV